MSFALCISLPETEDLRAHWDHVRANLRADELFIIGKGHYASAAELPDQPIVLVQPRNGKFFKGVISLEDFQHPQNATYLLGPDKIPMPPEILGGRTPEFSVYIPTGTNRDMFSFVAYAVVAWDRRMKLK